MIVYITTNIINGKKYIGKDEANNPKYLGSGNLLALAIKKYGRKNFIKETLAEAKDKKDLEELEIYYINYYNANNSELFYNIAPGGTGGKIAKDYKYREKSVVELDENNNIIGYYKSSKNAARINNLNYKTLNAVCNKTKKKVSGKVFIFEKDLNNGVLQTPYKQKYIHISFKTGIFYFDLLELYKAEFSYYKTFSSFKNYVFKHKDLFSDKFKTERI